jgi:hypothetical protein
VQVDGSTLRRDSHDLDTIFATFGVPDFRVKLQVNGCDFSAIVVSHLERDVSAPSPD